MTGLHLVVGALLAVCGATSRSEFMRRTSFQKAMKRSISVGGPAPSPAASPMGAPGPAPLGPCECAFQDLCTCESALAHLDCISKTCASEECDCSEVQFSQSCGQMASVCKPMLDISCTPKQAMCDGKYYQLSSSTVGLTIDIAKLDNSAQCGPSGKCTGKVDVHAAIVDSKEGMTMECFLEEAPKSKLKNHCSSEVSGDFANCTIAMPDELPPGEKLEGWCRLVDRADDDKSPSERLSQDAPFFIYNHHKPKSDPSKRKMAEAPPPKKAKPAKSSAYSAQGAAMLFIAAAAALYL